MKKFLVMLCAIVCFSTPVIAEETKTEIPKYYYSKNFKENILKENIEEIEFFADKKNLLKTSKEIKLLDKNESFEYGKDTFAFNKNATFEYEIEVPESGGYHLNIDYFVPELNYYELSLKVKINGQYQFVESKAIELPTLWKDVSQDYDSDDYGNEVKPKPERVFEWQNKTFNNSIFNLKTPLVFELKKGKNIITLENNDINFILGKISLEGKQKSITAKEYLEENKNMPIGNDFIEIEAEKYSQKSRSYISPTATQNQNFTPYDSKVRLMNFLDGSYSKDSGDWVDYEFEIKQDGFYYISFKYIAENFKNRGNFKRIYIDDQVLFDELQNYKFDYTSKIKNEILNVDGENIPIYFEKGKHSLKIETTADEVFSIYQELLTIIQEINNTSMEIKYITGNKKDKNRDWEIENYLPNLKSELLVYSEKTKNAYEKLKKLSNGKNNLDVSNLLIAHDNLIMFSEDLNFLVNNLDRFSEGNSSVNNYMALIIEEILLQIIDLDKIFITSDLNKIPSANISFAKNISAGTEKLINSFTQKKDQSNANDKNKLNIWVAKNAAHIELMRINFKQMEEKIGMKINISALGDEQKLLMATASGVGPDLVIGSSNFRPFDFALRGAIHNLREFDDFNEIIDDFQPETFVPFIINDNCYALPETVDFQVTYYRKDILDNLGLSVPKTWEETIKILPDLSRFGMTVVTPISTSGALKHFGTTIPFVQQNKGKVYKEDGSKVELGDPKTVEAFKLMTDLYTRYSLPESVPSFYNSFKRGTTPIGISSLQTYYLMRFGSPELTDQWGIAPSIGIADENGNIDTSQATVASCSIIMADSEKKNEAWQVLKWWMSEETQTNYSNEIKMRFGPEFFYSSANLKAFENNKTMPDEFKDVFFEQFKNTKEIPRNPAYFSVERELSDAWNKVVFQGVSPRNALDVAILKSNREIQKKLKEFGYMDSNGNLLKEFEMSSGEKVLEWKKEVKK